MTIETRHSYIGNTNNPLAILNTCNGVVKATELIHDRLYFATVSDVLISDSNFQYFRTDKQFHYESFYEDFGPLNLAMLYKFCALMHRKLRTLNRSTKRLVYCVSTADPKQRINAAYLIGAFMIIHMNKTAEEMWRLFEEQEQALPFFPFRDAAPRVSMYDLGLHDVFRGVETAVRLKWLKFQDNLFNVDEYEYYEKVENGDLNWIIPGKLLAFCGPHNKAGIENGYLYHSPETYFSYFRKHNVSTVVRLNQKMYDARRFTDAGFQHVDLFFVDGSCPDDVIVRAFIYVVEQAPGAVAVHCKAGLGRTGTLIASWMMNKFRLTAAECIAWTRICRPGSVIGPQQLFLIEKQDWLWNLNALSSPASATLIAHPTSSSPKEMTGTTVNGLVSQVDDIRISANTEELAPTNELRSETKTGSRSGTFREPLSVPETDSFSQGDRLMRIKATRSWGRQQTSSAATDRKFLSDGAAKLVQPIMDRVLTTRMRRPLSMKDTSRTSKKTVGVQPLKTVSTAVPGPVRKAAKHLAGSDASSSNNILSNLTADRFRLRRQLRQQQHQQHFVNASRANRLMVYPTAKLSPHQPPQRQFSAIAPGSSDQMTHLRRNFSTGTAVFPAGANEIMIVERKGSSTKAPAPSPYYLRRRAAPMTDVLPKAGDISGITPPTPFFYHRSASFVS